MTRPSTRWKRRSEISNQTVAAAAEAYEQARTLVREAEAALFPTITTSYNTTRQYTGKALVGGFPISPAATPAIASPASAPLHGQVAAIYTPRADLVWEVDIWGKIRRQIESNVAGAQVSVASSRRARFSSRCLCQFDITGPQLDRRRRREVPIHPPSGVTEQFEIEVASGTARAALVRRFLLLAGLRRTPNPLSAWKPRRRRQTEPEPLRSRRLNRILRADRTPRSSWRIRIVSSEPTFSRSVSRSTTCSLVRVGRGLRSPLQNS
jgi:hypothetical protein